MENCTGCGACVLKCPKNCIEMKKNHEGFLFPYIEQIYCVKCGICLKVCPVINQEKNVHEFDIKSYGAYNNNQKILLESSSGGIFSILAFSILRNKGVVFGAVFDENFSVIHSYIENFSELKRMRESKYVQSEIGESYVEAKKFLDSGRSVFFTGTPCQISGLLAYLGKEYTNLLTQDFICHGVPSPMMWNQYLKYHKTIVKSKIKNISFRNKNLGWKQFSIQILFYNNYIYSKLKTKEWWMHVFLNDLCLRESCYKCSFKTLQRQSDITLGDFWGVENVCPQINNDMGTSLIIINSIKGQNMFEQIRNEVTYQEVDLFEALEYNRAMLEPSERPRYRDVFFRDFKRLEFNKFMRKYFYLTLILKMKKYISRFIHI